MKEADPLDPGQVFTRIAEACHDPVARVWEEVEERVRATVLARVDDARERHAALVAECGLGADAPADTDRRRAVLSAYRKGLTSDVLPLLEATFEHQKPAALVAELLDTRFAAAIDAARALPDSVEAPWGERALERRPSDTLGRRVRKLLGRTFSAARKPDRTRPVPVRALALRHLSRHVVPIYDQSATDVMRSWAEWSGRLERAWAAWAEVALEILAGADAFQVPVADPEGDDEAWEDEGWARLREAVHELDIALGSLGIDLPHAETRSRCDELLGQTRSALESDVRVAGSFVFRPEAALLGAHPLPELDRTRAALAGWDAQIGARFALFQAFLSVLVGGAAVRSRLGGRIETVALEPLEVMSACADELSELAADARQRRPSVGSIEAFEDLRRKAEQTITTAGAALPDLEDVSSELESIVGDTVDSLQGIVRQSPNLLVLHRLDSRSPTTLRPPDTREVPFQDRTRQSLDSLRIERIRGATLEFGSALAPIHSDVRELPGVIRFAFDTAREELGSEEPKDDASERASMLAAEALDRAADVLRHAPERVRASVRAVQQRVATEMADGGRALLDRVAAGRMQSQLLRAQSRFLDVVSGLGDRLRPAFRRTRRRTRFASLKVGRWTRRALRLTRALLGDDGSGPGARSVRTVRAFASADSGPGHVPLVYQRLFSLDPVTDASFLVGRAVEIADTAQHWRRWREHDGVPLVLRGDPGSGVTSFIRIATDTLADEGAQVVRVDVERRIGTEEELVRLVAPSLGLEPADTLGDLAERILRLPGDTGMPEVVVLDGLEHLYLRVPGGTDVLERFLTFMSETEPRIFWLTGVGQPAWKLIAKFEPTAVSQVDDVELRPLSVERLKETVLQRHRRSGLRLRFAEPREGRTLLKRRLRRLRGTDTHQKVLEDDFFERLHRVSMGNLKLALFHWLLAADFEQTEGEVLMQPPRTPDFGVLEALDQTHNFTLKALLEHRTLTLDEYRAVFRMTRQESYQIFESLQNRRLIEALQDAQTDTPDDSEINRASRYRIRPLLVGAIVGHLRTLNIVH
ncbi:MAG: hypothetical protein WD995_01585 [Gemmatimonadota bacterium]